MHWLLSIMLLVMLLLVFRINGKDVLAPAFLSVTVFFVSSVVFAFNAKRWEIKLELSTILIIFSALIVFFFGTRLHVVISTNRYVPEINNKKSIYPYYCIPKWIIIWFMVFNAIALILMSYRASQIAAKYMGTEYILMGIRTALATSGESWGIHISILRESMYGIGYLCLAVFFINVMPNMKKNLKKNVYILLPVIPMLFAMFLSTGRTGFLRIMAVGFVVAVTIYTRYKRLKLEKFARVGIIAFVLLLIVFFQLGKATGKSQIFSAVDTLSIYVGSSIGALNEYLKNPYSYSNSFGGETLYGFRSILRIFFSEIESTPIPLPFTFVALGHNTNVYTALRRYINDFGLLGMYLIQFFKGVLFGNWWKNIKRNENTGLSLILYAYFIYDIFMQSIEENLLREMMTTAQIFILLIFAIVYKYLIRPYKRYEEL